MWEVLSAARALPEMRVAQSCIAKLVERPWALRRLQCGQNKTSRMPMLYIVSQPQYLSYWQSTLGQARWPQLDRPMVCLHAVYEQNAMLKFFGRQAIAKGVAKDDTHQCNSLWMLNQIMSGVICVFLHIECWTQDHIWVTGGTGSMYACKQYIARAESFNGKCFSNQHALSWPVRSCETAWTAILICCCSLDHSHGATWSVSKFVSKGHRNEPFATSITISSVVKRFATPKMRQCLQEHPQIQRFACTWTILPCTRKMRYTTTIDKVMQKSTSQDEGMPEVGK